VVGPGGGGGPLPGGRLQPQAAVDGREHRGGDDQQQRGGDHHLDDGEAVLCAAVAWSGDGHALLGERWFVTG
jgi:hypothetical protein